MLAGSIARVEGSRALAAAVAAGDRVATRRALRPLLRAQIVRIVVTRGGRTLARLGSGPALAPVSGAIRDAAGAPVGRYTLSAAADAGTGTVVRAVTGADVVMRGGRRVVFSTLPSPAVAAGSRYTVASFRGRAFPSGALRISVLTRPPVPVLCGGSAAQTAADTVGAFGERLFRAERAGAKTRHVLRVVAGDPRFIHAVATDDPAALRAQIVRFFRDPALHVVRIRAVTAGGRLVGDVGGPWVLAPASAPVRSHGRVIGRVTLSVQDDAGYIKLMRRLAGAHAILRTPAGEAPGSALAPGPAPLPSRGSLSVNGRSYRVFSFTATRFPSGPLRIWLLVR